MFLSTLLLLLLIALGFTLRAFIVGVQAFRLAERCFGPPATTLWLLWINICEPAINGLLIPLLIVRNMHNNVWQMLLNTWLCTLPMAVLLLPALWRRQQDEPYRSIRAKMLNYGATRWGLTVILFTMVILAGPAPVLLLIACFILLPLNIIVLHESTSWAEQQLAIIRDALAALPAEDEDSEPSFAP